MYSMARLFGLEPAVPSKARILELGCAAGGNLLPIAARYPDCECVGIDLSAVQIAEGNQAVEQSELKNVKLLQADISNLPEEIGTFDYIICHGVFSWVPKPVQAAIFEICRSRLTPNGIGYISYNTLPGWYMRNAIRGMMLKHVAALDDPKQILTQARALLNFLVESTEHENSPYAGFLKSETELLRKQSDQYLFHDHLEENNHPCFFQDFIAEAKSFDLQFLGESSLANMWTGNLPAAAQKTLAGLTQDIVLLGQYSDFVRNRTFRQTLLCRGGTPINRQLSADRVTDAYFRGRFSPEGNEAINLTSGVVSKFKSTAGHAIQSSDPVYKAMLVALTNAFPGSCSLSQLVVAVKELLETQMLTVQGTDSDIGTVLGGSILKLILSGAAEFSYLPDSFATAAPTHPSTTSYARWQASNQGYVTNLRHEMIKLGAVEKILLPLFDGASSIEAIAAKAMDLMKEGKLQLNSENALTSDQQRDAMQSIVSKIVLNLTNQGLFLQ